MSTAKTVRPLTAANVSVEASRRSILERMRAHRRTLSEYRQWAATRSALEDVFDEAVRVTASTLTPDQVALCVRRDGTGDLRMIAGSGWHYGVVGRVELRADLPGIGGYTLVHGGAVVVEDLKDHPALSEELLVGYGITSLLAVPIRGQVSPLGALGVFNRRRRLFTPDDVDFAWGIAAVVGAALYRDEWARPLGDRSRAVAAKRNKG